MSAEDMLATFTMFATFTDADGSPVSRELLDDCGMNAVSFGFRRFTHPWEFPDRNPMPRFTPFPRLARLSGRIEGARLRMRDIVEVARHGLPLED